MKSATISAIAKITTIALTGAMAIGLTACGTSGNTTTPSSTTSSEAGVSSNAVQTDFVGTYKLAALDRVDNENSLFTIPSGTLEITEDGTGTITFGDDSTPFTWEEKGMYAIIITVDNPPAYMPTAKMQITYENDAFAVPYDNEGDRITCYFTADGTYEQADKATTVVGNQTIREKSNNK